ncbi:hypothetical protein L211DRAFT_851778 [Terfezia boudieri ATCC MYA-4762]|uniref:Uncharacterized protein n=1 Tax=Terfezia boudieri ATCC MYA-4762 TaxID=1051890 RepID=A0A3N4LHS8_9PEZI|nr:hypothetical protein L211DRAFT_851778 [Terfezia boudieri ATCC MYA-4762]
METCPRTPPRRTRVETPDAPLHGVEYDKGKKRERKEKEQEKARQKEERERQKEKAPVCPPSSKAKSSVSFAPSPPGSPSSTGLPSPVQDTFSIFRDDNQSTTNADPFTGPAHPSTTKHKRFKPPPAPQNMRNPFAPEEASQESNGAESLPTPAKTPSRKRKFMVPSEEQEELDSASRILFSDSTKPKTPISSAAAATLAEILGEPTSSILASSKSSTRKKSSHKIGHGRDVARDLFGSSDALGSRDRGSIEIFTDSNARVPEYDPSPENPFVDHPEGSTRQLSGKQREKERKRRERMEKNREEFEALRAGREDGMVYTVRGMKVFRKFEEDNSRVLSGPVQRVLFPSARGTRSRRSRSLEVVEAQPAVPTEGFLGGASDDDEEVDHFAAISDSDNTPSTTHTNQSKRKATVENAGEKVKEKLKTVIEEEVEEVEGEEGGKVEKTDEQKSYADTEIEATSPEEEKKKVEPEKVCLEEQPDKRTRAPSVAPSVSSVASSNILSFGRRPRITKSVSNLSNDEGKAPALRRSKRLASVEPDPTPDIGKATIKQKLATKRGRSEDSALEVTGKWALEVQGGSRKKSRY